MKIKDKEKLEWLEKNLRRYTFDELHNLLLNNSFKIAKDHLDGVKYSKGTIYPWISSSLTLMKIYLGEPSANYNALTDKNLAKYAYTLLDLESYSQEIDTMDMLSKILVNQQSHNYFVFTTLYRSNFVYNFKNEEINMYKEFKSVIGISNEEVAYLFYFFYILLREHDNQVSFSHLMGLTENKISKQIFDSYTIQSNQLYEILHKNYNRFDQLILSNIHLDSYCFLSKDDKTYSTYPHNFITAYYPGTYHRIIFNNPSLREKVGKYLWEDYLYKLVSESNQFNFVEQEKVYKKNKNFINTPDVLALLEDDIFLFEMKSTMPTLGNRSNDNVLDISESTAKEASKLNQVYNRMKDYKEGYFKVRSENGEKNMYGIIVNLENTFISREKIFSLFFKEYLPSSTIEEQNNIKDTIRFIDLSDLELLLLFKKEEVFKKLLFTQNHDNLHFANGYYRIQDGIFQYQEFVEDFTEKSKIAAKLRFTKK